MKTIVLTLLVTLLIFPVAVPAFAQDMNCSHDGATIGDLRACLNHAVTMGHVDNQGVARSLFAKLDAAQAALDRGQTGTAVNILNAFINAVEAQSGSHIEAEHAAHIIAHAQQVIDVLT